MLIDGICVVLFSFCNLVDVNIIFVGLIKCVDVLIGGVVVVYGVDVVVGVVNFVLDDDFIGVEFLISYESVDGGNEKFNFEVIFGGDIVDGSGYVIGYIGYIECKELLVGECDYVFENLISMINSGGYYIDVVFGNSIGIVDFGVVISEC